MFLFTCDGVLSRTVAVRFVPARRVVVCVLLAHALRDVVARTWSMVASCVYCEGACVYCESIAHSSYSIHLHQMILNQFMQPSSLAAFTSLSFLHTFFWQPNTLFPSYILTLQTSNHSKPIFKVHKFVPHSRCTFFLFLILI